MDSLGVEPRAFAYFVRKPAGFLMHGASSNRMHRKGDALPTELRALYRIGPANLYECYSDSFSASIGHPLKALISLGGDPSADSPTDTLLRLNPPCKTQIRTLQRERPHLDLTRVV